MNELPVIRPGTLVVLIGPPGCGKSTLAAAAWPDAILSSDELRRIISGDECDQSATTEAFAILHRLLTARLERGLTTVVDATNTRASHRDPLLHIAACWQRPALAVVFGTDLVTCLARNAARPGPLPGQHWGRRVPDRVVAAMHQATSLLTTQELQAEGFGRVQFLIPATTRSTP